eukprot:8246804-Prorocentrum_lima.AAC.1
MLDDEKPPYDITRCREELRFLSGGLQGLPATSSGYACRSPTLRLLMVRAAGEASPTQSCST